MTYLLLAVVLAVWAVIIAKLVSYRPSDIPQATIPEEVVSAEKPETDRTLLLNYRDPFLEKSVPNSEPRGQGKRPVSQPEPLDPPKMEFKGVLLRDGRLYAMIGNGGPARIFGRGDTIGAYKVTFISPDSVTLRKGIHNYTLKQANALE